MSPIDENQIFRSLFAAYPDGLLLVDTDGRIVMGNPAAAALLGYTEDELARLHVDDLVPDAVRPRHAAHREAYHVAPRPRPMGTDMELAARRKDGQEVMVEIALSPLVDHGLPYVVAAVRGVGAYPRVQQAFKRVRYAEYLAQFGRFAVDMRDPQQLLQRAPAAAAEALEVEQGVLYLLEPDGLHFRVAGGLGTGPAEAVGTLVPNRPDTPPGHVLMRGRPVVAPHAAAAAPLVPQPLSPGEAWGSAMAVPLSDRGRVVGAMAVRARAPRPFGDDETRFMESLAHLLAATVQRVQSDEALRHAQRLESVGQLTGGIAHDFNNLLTIIQGNLQVLEDLPAIAGDELAEPLVTAASRATRRGAELTGKLLAFSRRQLLQPSRVDTARLVRSLADMLRRTLDQRIIIEVATDDACPPCMADAGQLESALLNIAINARDAMPSGGHLRFSAHVCESLPAPLAEELSRHDDVPAPEASDYVAIAVADTGTGMSEAVRQRAFEPFFTTKSAGRGTGLGLSTVYGFARQSHGGVTIDSAPGQGTTITLYIPRQPEAQAPAARPASGDAQAVPQGLRVLLVEDEPEVLRIARTFLAGWSCTVTECVSGEQALPLLADTGTAFDLLLTDVVLGAGLRGTELSRRARTYRPRLPVLLMSGYASDLRGRDAPRGERFDLLRKPFSREELAAAIVRVTAASPPPGAGSTG